MTSFDPISAADRHLAACPSLPEVGDAYEVLREVDSRGRRNGIDKDFVPVYDAAVVVDANEETCRYDLQQVSGFQKGQIKSMHAPTNGDTYLSRLITGGVLSPLAPWGKFLRKRKEKKFDAEFALKGQELQDFLAGRSVVAEDGNKMASGEYDPIPPPSGAWKGKTKESDGANQRILSDLRFRSDGTMSGRGSDTDDGDYTIKGYWSPGMVKWTETYNSNGPNGNFEVTVRAREVVEKKGPRKGEQKLDCFFVSTVRETKYDEDGDPYNGDFINGQFQLYYRP